MPTQIRNTSQRRPSRLYLKEWIKHRGLNYERLADRIDTSKSVISKLANQQQRYNQDWLEKIAWALDCEVAQLYRPPNAPTADELLKQMTPDDRERALRIISTLSEPKTGTDN